MKQILNIFLFLSPLLLANDNFYNHDLDKGEMLELGARLYKKTCISCHGSKGETNKAMELVVKPRELRKTILTAEQSYKIIKHGAHHFGAHADIMPAFKYVYNNEQISSLAYYVSHTFNAQRDERVKKLLKDSTKLLENDEKEALPVGKKIFQKKCALCHGVKGNGESDYIEQSKADENFIYPYNLTRTLLNENQIFLYAKFGGHYWGTDKNDMPSWSRKFNDVKLKSVAKYIQEEIKTSVEEE
jgi:mono/diheme cytochrome c family protein